MWSERKCCKLQILSKWRISRPGNGQPSEAEWVKRVGKQTRSDGGIHIRVLRRHILFYGFKKERQNYAVCRPADWGRQHFKPKACRWHMPPRHDATKSYYMEDSLTKPMEVTHSSDDDLSKLDHCCYFCFNARLRIKYDSVACLIVLNIQLLHLCIIYVIY